MIPQRHLATLLLLGITRTVETAKLTRIADARLASKQTELYFISHLFKHTHQIEEVLRNSTTHQVLHKWPMLDTAREALTELEKQLDRTRSLKRIYHQLHKVTASKDRWSRTQQQVRQSLGV